MNLKKTIDKYIEEYSNASHIEVARMILEDDDSISKSVRHLRRLVSQRRAELEPDKPVMQQALEEVADESDTPAWRRMADWAIEGQSIKEDLNVNASSHYTIDFSHLTKPIVVISLSDTHFGGWGMDYERLKIITDELLNNDNLYATLDGDIINLAIKRRGMSELKEDVLPPSMQEDFLLSWLDEVQHKILWFGWGNHDAMRYENALGYDPLSKQIARDRMIPYNKGIAHVDLKVGQETYKIAVSHFFLGRSYLNPLHSQQRYMRFQGLDREICIAGHTHTPALASYFDGPMKRLAINNGTLYTNSSYAKRFFSLYTMPMYPAIELYPNEHRFNGYLSLGDWLNSSRHAA